MNRERRFVRTIGIDYSGRGTPSEPLRALAVYCADGNAAPVRVCSQVERLCRWTRAEIARWLVEWLQEQDRPTLVGIDHAFSFPIDYFRRYPVLLHRDWGDFLDDFQAHWPTDEDNQRVRQILEIHQNRMAGMEAGEHRLGEAGWWRLTDGFAPAAAAVFNFNARQNNVAYSTHAGIPQLRHIRQQLRALEARVWFWPFDGWNVPEGHSVIVEVYPRLWNNLYNEATARMSNDQRDAYSVARWLSEQDQNGALVQYFNPELTPEQFNRARTEGWIFGVPVPN